MSEIDPQAGPTRAATAFPLNAKANAGAPGLNQPVKMSVKNLHFFYQNGHEALKGINLELREKTVTAFIGPSGCGKSTLLRVMNRMYDLYPGQRATGEVHARRPQHPVEGRRPEPVARQGRHGVPETHALPDVDLREHRLRDSSLRTPVEGRDEQPRRGGAERGGALGRGEGQAAPVGPRPVGRPAAAALHRPRRGDQARGALARRARLGARPDLDRQDRGPDRQAARGLLPSPSSPTTCSRPRAPRNTPPSCTWAS